MKYSIKKNEIKKVSEKLQYLTNEAIKIADKEEEKSEIREEADDWFSLGVGACEALEHIQEFEKFIEKNKIEEEKNMNTRKITEEEIEYYIKITIDMESENGISERRIEWLIQEAIMKYGDNDYTPETINNIQELARQECY